MSELKKCNRCKQWKSLDQDYYLCLGIARSECKQCTIKRNAKHQKKMKAWRGKLRLVDPEKARIYMRKYYAENKDKFKGYRAKYRQENPHYYKNYYRNKKNKK